MQRYSIEISGNRYEVNIDEKGEEMYQVVVDGEAFDVRLGPSPSIPPSTERSYAEISSAKSPPDDVGGRLEGGGGMKIEVRAPMPGVVLSIAVQPGDRVSVAQQLLVLEAMKMKNPISSTRNGVVGEVVVQAGQSVGYNDLLLKFEEA